MSNYIRLGFVLLLICAVASGILAYVNSITVDKIAANKVLEKEQAKKEVLPLATTFVEDSTSTGFKFFTAMSDSGDVVGYVFLAIGSGYTKSVPIETMVGLDINFKIINIKVIKQVETPGLGDDCKKPSFAQKFIGKMKDDLLVDKDGGKIASITGATITTRAVTNSIRKGVEEIEKGLTPKACPECVQDTLAAGK